MARIPSEVIDQIRNSVDISDVIGHYVQLHQSGKGFVGLCPFHEERTPSFNVNVQKQFYYCFGCGRGGNVFQFLMELKHIPFTEAVEEVAQLANMEVPSQYLDNNGKDNKQKSDTPNGKLMMMHEEAAKLYHHVLLNTPAGAQALKYLKGRGMTDELINDFNLGFAPEQRILKPFLTQKVNDYQLLRKSGLFVENNDGNLRDRFVGRVMYPLRNQYGRVIGFSGRVIGKVPEGTPKYLNSPETPIFNKRRTLFNFNVARKEARQTSKIYLFEGFMDVISAYATGVKNGVASMGTSLTEEQVAVLGRAVNQVDICYDGDSAGQNAIDRAITLFRDHKPRGMQLRVVQLPAGVDPDEYVQQNGASQFNKYLVDQEETVVDFYLRFYRMNKNLNNQNELISYLEQSLKLLATLPSSLEQDMYLTKLAKEFELDKTTLKSQLAEISHRLGIKERSPLRSDTPGQAQSIVSHPVQQQKKVNRTELAEQLLLRYMFHDQEVWDHVTAINNFHFAHERYQTLYLLAEGYFSEHGEYSAAGLMDYLKEDSLRSTLGQIEQLNVDEGVEMQLIDDCVQLIQKQIPLSQKIKELQSQIREASSLNNNELATQLTMELIKLLKKQQELKAEETN
ncbi:DNA primase [Limosilactobacillus fastidiosus]|uniref:DNA primase n=1 Tax=Limosilactobacillus fastidiosus TaxID=2759855 RepID=A0A7W3U066_9LACO|nr:DNA primase [Limosilactobacillus fastidiosus]MBB1086488.1 DNA primase [Limosilactobacillus fastidiosus]MCD7085160.1 DNA primase [Limosilactobacillus fastidiosus]MCD7115076.1 DNA primase [Limosilactobacillus fastidiosus]MCD7116240.1 DNA primase [Limosilactobacillus fastidiosus]